LWADEYKMPPHRQCFYVVRNQKTTNHMKTFAVIAMFVLIYSVAIGQEINLKQLYKVYQTDKIDTAFKRFSSVAGFSGRIMIDSQGKASRIEGKIGLWTLTADIFKGRGRIKLQIEQKRKYQAAFVQAEKYFYSQGDYARGSRTESRHTYAFSNTKEMNDGDLWLLLTEVITKEKKEYFEVELRKYPYNDTD
jgi:hypothetical protein